MIAFKVVEKQTRHCTNWTLFKKTFKDLDTPFYTDILKFKHENPQWFPRYFKGRVIEAASGSVGIFCFEAKLFAMMFQDCYTALRLNGIIIKVEGIGEPTPRRRIRIVSGCGNTNITSIKKDHDATRSAPGTLCFKSVKVLS